MKITLIINMNYDHELTGTSRKFYKNYELRLRKLLKKERMIVRSYSWIEGLKVNPQID